MARSLEVLVKDEVNLVKRKLAPQADRSEGRPDSVLPHPGDLAWSLCIKAAEH